MKYFKMHLYHGDKLMCNRCNNLIENKRGESRKLLYLKPTSDDNDYIEAIICESCYDKGER